MENLDMTPGDSHSGHAHHGKHAPTAGAAPDPRDPVCGMKVDPVTPRGGSFEHAGTTYGFCSPGCR